MLKYNNTHIFTGYLKQLLSSFSLPACKVYTREFNEYFKQHGKEDPRVLESFDSTEEHVAVRINYLKNNEVYNYFSKEKELGFNKASWQRSTELYYDSTKIIPGFSRTLNSPGVNYDTKTHEYLGDYLRFLRDYYNINLMSLYNCFTDKFCNNLNFSFELNPKASELVNVSFNSQDPKYKIYMVPVKLFANYTIAIDCEQGVELFCGLYNTTLNVSNMAANLARRTYQKVQRTLFSQPFLYDKLDVKYWPAINDFTVNNNVTKNICTDKFTRWDITNREKDLRLFIKVPVSCQSTITILEGDYRAFNDSKYTPISYKKDGTVFNPDKDELTSYDKTIWAYQQNHNILNFNTIKVLPDAEINKGDGIDLNNYNFKPISKLQLLTFNTGVSYPFADRLIEYLSGSAITPMDELPDNIKRVQRVMNQNKNYFKIEGLWENKMQNIIYDYMINSGPIVITGGKLVDRRHGYHQRLGHTSKSTLYDVLGYVDKEAEKWYASWKKDDNKATIDNNIQNVDIYNGLYDID